MITRPIFIIRFPNITTHDDIVSADIHMKEKNADLFKEYHVMYVKSSNSEIEFEVFNANSIPKAHQKRTKGLILDIISKLNN